MIGRDGIEALDRRHVWHPYTPMDAWLETREGLVLDRAEGSRLFDVDGRSYLDGNASWWCAVLGHGHPRLTRAIEEQSRRMAHVPLAGIAHAPAAELASALIERAPQGLSRVFYSDNGSTAIEAALKLCLQYWHQNGAPRKTRFVTLDGAFHGETLGAAGLGGVEVFRRPFASVLLDTIRVSPSEGGFAQAFESLSQVLSREADQIAAVVLEPMVQGASGMQMYDARFLLEARELTRRHDVVLVLDEVFTGFGRTGPFWASEHAGIAPDVLCSAKGLSGGMLPFAATLVTERLFQGFSGAAERAFLYGHTFCGNPLGARLALEVLRVFDDEAILKRAEPKAKAISDAFQELASLPGVRAVRSLGMIGALDLSGPQGYLEQKGQEVYRQALRRGAYLRPLGNTVYVTPALNIPDDDLLTLLRIVREAVRAALSGTD